MGPALRRLPTSSPIGIGPTGNATRLLMSAVLVLSSDLAELSMYPLWDFHVIMEILVEALSHRMGKLNSLLLALRRDASFPSIEQRLDLDENRIIQALRNQASERYSVNG